MVGVLSPPKNKRLVSKFEAKPRVSKETIIMSEITHNHPKLVLAQTHLTKWVCRNQLVAFFVLTFVFSWSIYLVAGFAEFNNQTI